MNFFDIVVRAIVLLTAIPIHEAAHAYVADKMGDPTGRYMGRLTLNPMAHFDLVGSIAMLVAGIGWAKHVPINPRNFREPKKGMAISAAAGPISNLIVAAISLSAAKILMYVSYQVGVNTVLSTLFTIFNLMCSINISLAIFNLIPIPPFDGSRIFNYFLPDKFYFKVMEYEQYIVIGLLIILFTGVLDVPLAILSNLIFGALDKLTGVIDIFGRVFMHLGI
ncbi:MAG: site-2 protease family protein [Oscillospiraceae bacterium]|nr:site-2 protease family protein [Oscillospiraceae bacterium]